MTGLFAGRDFRLLLVGQTTSQLGAQVSGIAMPLVAVVTLRASPFQVGLLTAASTVAFLVIGLPAGAWLDQMRRRPVLVASDVVRGVLLGSVPLAAAFGVLTMGQLLVVALLSGFARVFFDVGYQSYLPSVVGRDRVLAGNSALETIRASGQFAGPGVGGWLVATLGAANVLLVQTVTFFVSAFSIGAIRTVEERPAPPDRSAGEPLWARMREGLRFVLSSRPLRVIALTSAVSNLTFAAASAVNVIFVVRELGLSPTFIGLAFAVGAGAAMLGATLTALFARLVGSVRVIWLSLAVTAPFTVLVPLAQPGWRVSLFVVGLAVGELGQIVYSVTQLSLRQTLCPNHLLARTNATMRFLVMGAIPLGGLTGGVLGETVGLRGTLWLCAVALLAAPIPLYAVLRRYRDVDDIPAPTLREPRQG